MPDVPLPVETILALDAEFRYKAGRSQLNQVAPKTKGSTKLLSPIMTKEVDGGSATLFFSGSPQARMFGKTDDWVRLIYKKGTEGSDCLIYIDLNKPFKGRRVIRGREKECLAYFRNKEEEG